MKGAVMTTNRVSILMGAAIGFAALLGGSAISIAADLGLKDTYAPPPPQRTWYLKGTIGMHNHEVGGLWTEGYDDGNFTLHHKDMKTAPFFGVGIGVDHGRWLRFDVTGEYRGKWVFLAQDSYADIGFGAGANEYTADIESWLGLVNAYVDLGQWCGVTPYVGGGIGMASVSVLGLRDTNPVRSTTYYGADHTEYNFAWALYAGMSYDVTDRVTLDFAYRYLDLGDAKTGRATDYLGTSSYSGVELSDITSHDLMLSARFALDRREPIPVAIK
jgi:opacity protein-like surface antigen